MLLFVIIAALAAKAKKYTVSKALKSYTLFPLYATELIYAVFQIFAFCGDYRFIQYAYLLQWLYFASLIFPILKWKLYIPAVTGAGLTIAGTILNKAVMAANGGKMPVFPSLSLITGYFKPDFVIKSGDTIHILGNEATKLNFFADYIDVGYSVLSIGDVLIHSFVATIVYFTIKSINERERQK